MIVTKIEKDLFVKNNLGLVHSCANRFRGRGIEYDDLYSAGCLGLIKAIDGFDETRGIMFSTYAVPVILGEIRRLFRDGGSVKVSRSLKELSLKITREKEIFIKKHGYEPSLSELSQILDESVENIIEALNISIPPISLTVWEDDSDETCEFDIPQNDNNEKLCEIISLKDIISQFDEKDRNLLILRYFKEKTQAETARILNMTQVQVSRQEKKLLNLIRKKLE